jgi:Zn-dependent protease with chaperone function
MNWRLRKERVEADAAQAEYDSMLAVSQPASGPDTTELMSAYYALCEKHAIKNPPQVFVANNMAHDGRTKVVNAFAYPRQNGIFMEKGLLEAIPDPKKQLGVLVHELAHVVLGHPIRPSRSQEREADQLTCLLYGDRALYAQTIREIDATKDTQPKLEYPLFSYDGLDNKRIDLQERWIYGTTEDRVERIMMDDLATIQRKFEKALAIRNSSPTLLPPPGNSLGGR